MVDEPEARRISFAMRARVPDSVLLQEVEGEIVALSLESELYLGLNASGKEIFEQLTRADSIEEAFEALLESYDVEPKRLRAELSDFIGKLLEQRLLELSEP